jgi:hypothetical protein
MKSMYAIFNIIRLQQHPIQPEVRQHAQYHDAQCGDGKHADEQPVL